MVHNDSRVRMVWYGMVGLVLLRNVPVPWLASSASIDLLFCGDGWLHPFQRRAKSYVPQELYIQRDIVRNLG